MEIKRIKLSPKKGGNGFISSYSVNIGSSEARECELIGATYNKVIIKIVDPNNHQIVIKEKQCTLNEEVLHKVMGYASRSNELNIRMELSLPGTQVHDGYREVNLAEIPILGIDTDNPYANELHALEREFYEYLLNLPYEMLTDLLTLMYMGRDQDADMTLPSTQRFADYWGSLDTVGCFSEGSEAIASQMMDKMNLSQYLQVGRRIMLAEVEAEKVGNEEDFND